MEGKPTREQVLAAPPGDLLDDWVEDALGIDRRLSTPGLRHDLIRISLLTSGHGDRPDGARACLRIGRRKWWISDRDIRPHPRGHPEHWLWAQREGKPWQAALEKCVEEYRLPPSHRWSQDWAAVEPLVEHLRKDDWLVTVKWMPAAGSFVVQGSRSEYDAPAEDRLLPGSKGKVAVELSCMDQKRPWPRGDVWVMAKSASEALAKAAVLARLSHHEEGR